MTQISLPKATSPNEATQRFLESLRECPPDDPCDCLPCRHIPYPDPDLMGDIQDLAERPEFHDELWNAYYNVG
jgi:hypothetical protein